MATLLRNTLRTGVLDANKRALSPRPSSPLSPSPILTTTSTDIITGANKATSTHQEYLLPAANVVLPPLPLMPPGSWDSHMHILDPDRYPLAPNAVYKPSRHTVPQAVAFEASVGASHVVIVQPSIYGTDDSCLLDALRALGPSRARGVVAFDPDHTSPATLREWHDLGVRGVRLNLQSTGQTFPHHDMVAALCRYADLVRPLGWVVQLYIPLAMVAFLEHIMPSLNVRICIDHMGSPEIAADHDHDNKLVHNPYSLDGFSSLVRLLEGGQTYVKMSAPYRLSKHPDYISAVKAMAKELLRVAPTRVLFATDWPHTRFEGLDIRPWIENVRDWCGDGEVVDRVFRANARELWA